MKEVLILDAEIKKLFERGGGGPFMMRAVSQSQ